MSLITEHVYPDRDNTIDWILKADGVAQNLSQMTKMVLKLGSKTIEDEEASQFPIKWSGLGVTGKISMQLGDQSITAGQYAATLIVYDSSNPNGIHWGKARIIVHSSDTD